MKLLYKRLYVHNAIMILSQNVLHIGEREHATGRQKQYGEEIYLERRYIPEASHLETNSASQAESKAFKA